MSKHSDLITKAPNISHLWAQLIVEELVRCGVTQFFVAPGSRSTPLVSAIARHPQAEAIVHFDERGNAFAALGYARATRKPAVWVTTSGTALANGLPAVIEASVEEVPMLLLTADRPPELRQTGANQTIHQPGIFGVYTKWSFDGPVPNDEMPASFVLSTIDQAVHRATEGPVHLNWMFREPLEPISANVSFDEYLQPVEEWIAGSTPYTSYPSNVKTVSGSEVERIVSLLRDEVRGVIVAGRMDTREEGMAVLQLAEKLKWPVFADIGSQIVGVDKSNIIQHYDFLLPNIKDAEAVQVVLQFGRRSTSKKLLKWIETISFEHYIVVDRVAQRLDPIHQVNIRLEANIQEFCEQLLPLIDDQVNATWLNTWKDRDAAIGSRLDTFFDSSQELTEPGVARAISLALDPNQLLVLGNSMPVRDMDTFSRITADNIKVILNRGASGIDGTIATDIWYSIWRSAGSRRTYNVAHRRSVCITRSEFPGFAQILEKASDIGGCE